MSFENDDGLESHKQCYLTTVEIKDYNVIIDGRNFFDQPTGWGGQGDDFTIGCLLDYPFFKKYHKLITIDLKNQEKLDSDPKAIQQIDFTGNLDRAEGLTLFFIIKEAKES